MDILHLHGSRRQVGRQYGEACHEGYRALHAQALEAASHAPRWHSDVHAMRRSIGEAAPGYLQELAGTAEGANLTLGQVLLNQRLFLSARHLDDPCCTNVAFLDPVAPVFGKNLDLAPDPDRAYVLRDVDYAEGVRIVHSTVIGEITSRDTCMNDRGLAIGGSSVGSVFQQSIHHPPVEAGLYEMLLACGTVGEAIDHMLRHPWVGKGYNFVLVDADGDGAVLECACPLVQVRRAERDQDAVFCTNTYQLPSLQHADLRTPTGRAYSDRRYRYLERKLFVERVPRTQGQMQAMLAAHGPEGGLCRPIDEHDPSRTYMSVVALPAERRFLVADGRPCEVPFEPVWPATL